MKKGFKFNWLTQTSLISSKHLLLVWLTSDMSFAAEVPTSQRLDRQLSSSINNLSSLELPSSFFVTDLSSQISLVSIAQGSMTKRDTEETPAFPIEGFISVDRLSDVQTSDWTYQAWQSFVKRYNCPTKDFDSTISTHSALSRSEFAVGLYNCFHHLSRSESIVTSDDLKRWERLQTDFTPELAALQRNTSNLEVRTQQLEENLFSTTTKLEGEVLFVIADSFGDSLDSGRDESQTFLGNRVRLNFDTSFDGKDLLRTRIESTNIGRLDEVTGTVMTRLAADGESDNEVDFEVNYGFKLGDRTLVRLGTGGIGINDAGETLNPLSSSSRGAVSRFGRRDPITLRGAGSTGALIQYEFSDRLQANLGYSTPLESASSAEEGFFNSSFSAISQLLLEPTDSLKLAFTYTRKYQTEDNVSLVGDTGSFNANEPFGQNATSADNFGIQFNWQVNNGLEFGGWFGYAQAEQEQGDIQRATILNGALTFTFPDLLAEANVGGIIIGVPPIVTSHDNGELEDRATSLHLEALYRIQVRDNLEITPGFFLITNPNHESRDSIFVGTIRSRFTF